MRKLVLKMSISLDGFVGGPRGEIDWMFPSMDPGVMGWLAETLGGAGLHAMGSRTYQDMAAYWPQSTGPLADAMNEIPKIIFSRSGAVAPDAARTTAALEDASRAATPGRAPPAGVVEGWRRPRVASGPLAEEIARLKREPGRDILAHGGAGFARSLVGEGLVDELRLLVHPVALGSGLQLFSGLGTPLHLRLSAVRTFEAGAVAKVYRLHDS